MASSTDNSNSPLKFRAPPSSSSNASSASSPSSTFSKPSTDFLSGIWYVTHSTLPMWKSNRNVRITYTPLPLEPTSLYQPETIDDLVEYQPLGSDKWKTINGLDKADDSDEHRATYNWRGKGWLKIASSRWSLLGWGDDEGGWAVTFFEKTLFTPAGVDIYARRKGGLSEGLVQRIRTEIERVAGTDEGFRKQADGIFEIRHDWETASETK